MRSLLNQTKAIDGSTDVERNGTRMDQKIKQAFAYERLKDPSNPFKAAMKLTKGNSPAALHIVDTLVHDDQVAEFKRELLDKYGEAHFLPSKFDMVRDCIDRGKATLDNDAFQKLYKLAADMMGYIEKPGVTINNNNMTSNKVMLIPAPQLNANGSINQDDWQNRAIEQQQQVIEGEVA